MSDTKKIIRADLDEIVEAVIDSLAPISGVNDEELTNIRTALERFVVEEEDATDIDAWNSALDEMNNTTPKKGGDDEG